MSTLVLPQSDNSLLPRLLDALGAIFAAVGTFEEAVVRTRHGSDSSALILSEEQLVAGADLARTQGCGLGRLLAGYQRVLIYPFSGRAAGLRALGELVHARVEVAEAFPVDPSYTVSGSEEMCGPFTGLRCGSLDHATDRGLTVTDAECNVDFIVAVGDAGLVTRFSREGTEVFVISSRAVFDVDEEHGRNLNVGRCFSALVPLLFFLRHCGIPRFESPHRWANWIIDDLNLKPRYGFLRLRDLAETANRAGAAATIAFIPWNYRRTPAGVVNLFHSQGSTLSVCVHGCDHTRAEFSTKTDSEAFPAIALAVERMRQFKSNTGLGYESVMVFPQGAFSRSAMCALRHSEMLAAVNTELTDEQTGRGVKGGELLKPAITCYGGFPLFLRRRAEEPIADFALDLLLGKPCLIVTHHRYFRHGMQPFTRLVESLNALDSDLAWRRLEDGIAATYSVRIKLDGSCDVELFSPRTALSFDNGAEQIAFVKSEPMAGKRLQVLCNGEPIGMDYEDGRLGFRARIPHNSRVVIEVAIAPAGPVRSLKQNATHRFRVAARRYLSEFRDNYLDRYQW